jgi:hypothetical protein
MKTNANGTLQFKFYCFYVDNILQISEVYKNNV